MRNSIPRLLLSVAIVAALQSSAYAEDDGANRETNADVSVCFTSPESGCASRIVAAIDGAKTSILAMQLFLSNKRINNAFVRASQRGVQVKVIVDFKDLQSNEQKQCSFPKNYVGGQDLANAGIAVFTDNPLQTAHNKVTIIDGELVIGGSYNFSNNAEKKNIENATFIKSPVVAGWFTTEFNERLAVSPPYVRLACDF